MRDHNDNFVIVCSIENIDPMGVHTGDSVTVAPQQTLTDRLYQQLRDQAIAVIRAVGVETGGSNVQFAVNPETEEILVIEMNPRVSRSSALASKATGFPIAKIAARLAVGYALEEIDNDITQADARHLRADDRLRRRQVAALRLREVRRRRRGAVDAHEVGGRGDGDRPHVRPGVRQGDALARARRRSRPSTGSTWTRLLDGLERRRPATATTCCSRRLRRGATRRGRPRRARASTSGSCASCATRARPRGAVRRRALVQVGRHLRRRVRGQHAVLLLRLGARRGDATRSPRRPRRAWSSSAPGPTASARASSSTTAACTPR